MENKLAEKIIKRCERLESELSNWRNYHQELADFALPRKANIVSLRTKGDKLKMTHLYDATAILGLKIMSAGFHSNLTNPSSKWFNLRTRNHMAMTDRTVLMWLKEVEDIVYSTLASSNFDTTMQEFYLNAGCFGTAAVFIEEDAREKVRFTEIPIEQIAMEEDAYGRINRMYRMFNYTVQQAYDRWGNDAGEAVLEKIKDKPDDTLKFVHYVGPRDKYVAGKADNVNMPFQSVWVEKSKKHMIGEGGYQEFPYAVGRFYKDTNDVMGYSPVMDILSWVKLVNAQQKTMLRASMKQSDPAYMLPRKGFVLPLNLNPGATNYYDTKVTAEMLQQIPSNGNIPITLEVIQQVQQGIREGLFVPLFQALSGITKQMTVPEVQRRISENMVLLGPVVGRFTEEVLDVAIERTLMILFRNGELPIPPEGVMGEEIDIVYVSPLAKAQRESEIYSIEAFMADVGLVASAKPACLDKINEDEAVDVIAKVRGVDPKLIHSDDVVKSIREERAKVEQARVQAEQMNQGADTLAKAAKAAGEIQTQ